MKERGGTLRTANVGDRHVAAAMRAARRRRCGGEQSGHLIFREYSTTGDGLLAAAADSADHAPAREAAFRTGRLCLTPYPQELRNVHVERKTPFEDCPDIAEAVERIESGLEGRGRVLLRYSGTEPLCRVMVEGQDAERVRAYAKELREGIASARRLRLIPFSRAGSFRPAIYSSRSPS